ncbi:hypothetical protein KR009_003073, partial [Drosophila setifemur]
KMAQTLESTNRTTTEIIDETDASTSLEGSQSTPTLQLRLEQPRDQRRVVFHAGVIDNEHLNRKKSKCCCIYKKTLAFGESSSEDDEECEHCFGHPERRKKNVKHSQRHDHEDHSIPIVGPEEPSTSAQAMDNSTPLSEPVMPANPLPPSHGADLEQT